MKPCEKFRGKNNYLVELLTTHRHLKYAPNYTLLFVRRQVPKRSDTIGLILNNVLKACQIIHCVKSLSEESLKLSNKCSESTVFPSEIQQSGSIKQHQMKILKQAKYKYHKSVLKYSIPVTFHHCSVTGQKLQVSSCFRKLFCVFTWPLLLQINIYV